MATSCAFQMLPENRFALFFLPTANNILMLGFSKPRFFPSTFMGDDSQKSPRSCWKRQYLCSQIYLWNSKFSSDKPSLLRSLVGLWSRSQPIKCQCCPHIETSQLICCANQLTGFYMRATLTLNGLILTIINNIVIFLRVARCFLKKKRW